MYCILKALVRLLFSIMLIYDSIFWLLSYYGKSFLTSFPKILYPKTHIQKGLIATLASYPEAKLKKIIFTTVVHTNNFYFSSFYANAVNIFKVLKLARLFS